MTKLLLITIVIDFKLSIVLTDYQDSFLPALTALVLYAAEKVWPLLLEGLKEALAALLDDGTNLTVPLLYTLFVFGTLSSFLTILLLIHMFAA